MINKEKCQWVKDEKTGDLVMLCHGKEEGARIPEQVMKYSSDDYSQATRFKVKELKGNIEKLLGCDTDD